MKLDEFLSLLKKVRRTGKNSWLACCPAHEDRSPSMSVGLGDDQRILVRCFAECGFEEIVSAVGMEVADFFPERIVGEQLGPMRIPAADVLAALADELMIIEVITCDLERGLTIPQDDYDRLHVAISRVTAAKEAALGKR
jgi:hypothetical protein